MEGLLATGFWGGALAGFLAGMAFAIARRAYRDYVTVKNSVPGMRKNAFKTAVTALGWAVVVLAIGVALVLGTTRGEGTVEPASVPSPSAS